MQDVKNSFGIAGYAKGLLRGCGQVMFQGNAWTGVFFLVGICWGAFQSGTPEVFWGALLGLVVSTTTGFILGQPLREGALGLWGFNGILVGCAFPTFLATTPLMWLALIVCAALTVWVRTGFNHVMAPWKVNSLTFPFVFVTWMMLFASKELQGLPSVGLSEPTLVGSFSSWADWGVLASAEYVLRGISQVFLIDSWVTGLFFLFALYVSSRPAALWAVVGSAVALGMAWLFRADGPTISHGLYGFSPVLTAIALGCTFYKPNWLSAVWTFLGVVVTFFVQAGMDALMLPFGLPTLTAPFCITTWLFLLPLYKFDAVRPDHSNWHDKYVTSK